MAAFFSGGVDSFYTALTLGHRLSHLVFVHGFALDLAAGDLRRRAAAARAAAESLGKEFVEVETDLRGVVALDWARLHGSALAAIAHTLGVGTVAVAVTHTYSELFPWGSHPALDPLWSSSRTRLMHHGATMRSAKVKAIAQEQVALDHLRVCWRNPEGAYNCGKCEKCVRTMLALEMNGALTRCRTLPSAIDRARVQALTIESESDVLDNVRAAERIGRTDIASDLRVAMLRSRGEAARQDHAAAEQESGPSRTELTALQQELYQLERSQSRERAR